MCHRIIIGLRVQRKPIFLVIKEDDFFLGEIGEVGEDFSEDVPYLDLVIVI